MVRVWHYDGSSAVRYELELQSQAGGFQLLHDGALLSAHRWDDLVPVGQGQPVYGLKDRKGWQIGFDGAPPPEVATHLPKTMRYGGFIDRIGLAPALIALALLSASVGYVVMKAPATLAPLIPFSWEKKLGDTMIGDFGGRLCHGPGSDEAVKALQVRLDPSGPPLEISIANIAMVNAVALPGGRIVVFKGLLKESKSPDEVAGVIAHEIGHVRKRHVMQSLMRQMGLSVVIGGAGSDAAGYVDAIISSGYSRDAESAADAYAMAMMRKANVSADDTARFFKRMAKLEKEMGQASVALSFIASHPLSSAREKAFRASVDRKAQHSPVLTAAQWAAMQTSCEKDPKVSKDDSFLF